MSPALLDEAQQCLTAARWMLQHPTSPAVDDALAALDRAQRALIDGAAASGNPWTKKVHDAIHRDPVLLRRAQFIARNTKGIERATGVLLLNLPTTTDDGIPYTFDAVRDVICGLL